MDNQTTELLQLLSIRDSIELPNAIQNLIDLPLEERNEYYDKISNLFNNDFSFDWFQNIYESELAQRSQNKQDFTPNVIGKLLSKISFSEKGKIYEPTAGNGSLLISNWSFITNKLGGNYCSENHPIECWELSGRSIPILLFNLSIRGIIGIVNNGDVLTKDTLAKYQLTQIANSNYSLITKIS